MENIGVDPWEVLSEDWKDFKFVRVAEADYSRVLDHLSSSFYKDEPIQKMFGMPPEREKDLNDRVTMFLKENLSIMGLSKSTGKIAGVVINSVCSKDKPMPELIPSSPITKTIRHMLTQFFKTSTNIYEAFNVDKYGEIFILSTLPEFRAQGLGSELFRRGILLLEKMGCGVIESTFTNPISRRIGEKFGFVEVARLYFKDAQDEKGDYVLRELGKDQFVVITVLDCRHKSSN